MEELKNVRTTNRRLFTKACNEFNKVEATLSADDKIAQLKIIEQKAQLMIESENSIRQLYFKGSDKTENEIEKEIDESEAYIDKWRLLEQKLKKLSVVESDNLSNVEVSRNTLLHYPKIKLPTFDGNVRNWLGFWGQFKKIDCDPNLDDHDKFAYLLQSMEKGSTAEELIKGFPPGGASYSRALQQLQARYGREDLLIEVYVRDLLSLILLKNSNQKFSLRKLYDSLESKLRALEVLGVAREKYAAMLYPLVESSLPDDTLRAWQRFRAVNRSYKDNESNDESSNKKEKESTHRLDLDGLLSFLLDEIEGEERVSIASKCFDKNQPSKSWNTKRTGFKRSGNSLPIPSASTLISTTSGDKHNFLANCIFCSGNHVSSDCCKARNMPLNDRQTAVEKSRSCFLCLKTGHVISKCKVRVNCLLCGKRHHLLLCRNLSNTPDTNSVVESEQSLVSQDEALANISKSPSVILQTLTVIIQGPKKQRTVRAIIDSASQRSYILKKTAIEVGYRSYKKEQLRHSLFGGSHADINHEVFTVHLSKIDRSYSCHFEALGQEIICDTMPPAGNGDWIQELKKSNIHLHDREDGPIEILIGADIAGKIMTGGYKLLPSGLAAVETKLGWTILGKNPSLDRHESAALLVTSLVCTDTCISNLWSLESIGILDPSEKKSREELHEAARQHFLKTVKIDTEGRFVVDLPWLNEHPLLPENFQLALKRLNNATKTLKTKNIYEAYDQVFKEWEKEGIIEEVPEHEISLPSHYLPHRPVVKENSTTRIRPVFDASAKMKFSPSLNDCLEKGLNLIELIPSIMTRFRLFKIGVTADIRKAFLQIRVSESDKNYLRFLWYDENFKLKYFRHCRVVFGVTCSPFLLASVIQYHLQSALDKAQCGFSKYRTDIIQQLASSFYVDNCLVSVKDEMQLQEFICTATELLLERKFELRGWEYTDVNCHAPEPTNILGMLWDRANDTLSLKVTDNLDITGKVSKRSILAAAHKVFDPLGIACPVTLTPKLLLQKLWKSKLTWDQEVDSSTKEEFFKWLNSLESLKEIKIPRWIQCDYKIDSLHFFCDASKSAYSAVAFVKVCSIDSVRVHLLRAKSRIAPCGKKETTIARLELLAATITARLSEDILKEFKGEKTFFWTDSTTVLAWLNREEPWGVFVQNRVQEIRNLTPLEAWRHVPGSLNPADLPSRGCSARQLLKSKWWEGPLWLYSPAQEWPQTEYGINEEEVLNERKKGIVSSMINIQHIDKFISDRFSSYIKTIRMVGWIYRFYNNTSRKNKLKGELTTDEYKKAEIVVLRLVQSEQLLENKLLKNLKTFKDENGLLRVQTKLFDCEETEEFQNPIVLPSKHDMVLKLVTEEHKQSLHSGLSTLLARLREKYWILGVRKLVKQVISKCVICKRHSAKPLEVPFAPLPKDRVTHANVFEVSGVDYAGPLYLRSGEKAWIILFTCAVYRAVHLEPMKSLSTESFIQGLRRFISRRGRVSILYSDNGTSFTGTNNALKALDWGKINSYSTTKQISWKFIPPTAAWWGGWWERMVRMLKELLRRMLGKSSLDYEELLTVLCDCEAVINSRPLTYISSSPDELIPLTPSMFLVNSNSAKLENPDLDIVDKIFLTKRSRYLQKLREDLRVRFRNEYFAQLVHRGYRKNNSLKVGDIVLIGNEAKKRLDWPLGIVVEIYPGRDGITRVAKLKTHQGDRLRPFQRLYPLELSVSDVNDLKLPFNTQKVSPETDCPSDGKELPILPNESSAASLISDRHDSENTIPIFKTTRIGRKIKVPNRLDL